MKKFTGIFFACITLLVLGACGDSGKSEEKTEKAGEKVEEKVEKSEEKTSDKSEEVLGVGDTAEVDGETYTLTSVELTDERNEFDETNPAYVVMVKWTVENTGEEDVFAGAGMDFYDASKTKAETYPLESKQDNIAPGMKFEAQQAFGISTLGEYEIHISPFFDLEGQKVIFKGIIE